MTAAARVRVALMDYVVDLDRPGRSGLSDIVWDLASQLVDLGHDVHVVAPYDATLAPDARVPVHTFRAPPYAYRWHGGYLWTCKRMADLAVRLRPDVIHSPEYISIAVLETLYPDWSARTVLTVPGSVYQRLAVPNASTHTALGAQVLKWAATTAARGGGTVVAISEDMRRWWSWTGSIPERTTVIPLGVNLERFHCVPGARRKLGLPEDRAVLLYSARFSREKGVLLLLDALERARGGIPDGSLRVVIMGKGVLKPEIERRVARAGLGGIVQLEAWRHPDELSAWYSAADAVVSPSYAEAFSRVAAEAMACGTPCIGTDVALVRDHITDDVNGYAFPVGDADALARLIERLAREPERFRVMRAQTAAYAREHLGWPSVARRVVDEAYAPIVRVLKGGAA